MDLGGIAASLSATLLLLNKHAEHHTLASYSQRVMLMCTACPLSCTIRCSVQLLVTPYCLGMGHSRLHNKICVTLTSVRMCQLQCGDVHPTQCLAMVRIFCMRRRRSQEDASWQA